jgi:hypothetical protein
MRGISRRGAQKPGFELLTVSAVDDPTAGSCAPLARRNARSIANHGHDITMTPRPGAQNAEAVLRIMVGYSLDEACQHFVD